MTFMMFNKRKSSKRSKQLRYIENDLENIISYMKEQNIVEIETNNNVILLSKNEETDKKYLDIYLKDKNVKVTISNESNGMGMSFVIRDNNNNEISVSPGEIRQLLEPSIEDIISHIESSNSLDIYK